MSHYTRNIKIAEYLGLASSYSIRRVEEWQQVYFVLPVVGRPIFVSKAAIDEPSVDNDTVQCKVLAVTKPRRNRFAGTFNTGVLLMDTDGYQFWMNDYRYYDHNLSRGDIVVYSTKHRAINVVLHGNRRAMLHVV